MTSHLVRVIYLLLACVSCVFGIYFFAVSKKSSKLLRITFMAILLSAGCVNYAFLLQAYTLTMKAFFFDVHIMCFTLLTYGIYDFILVLTNTTVTLRMRLPSLILFTFFVFSYVYFPFRTSFELMGRLDWRATINTLSTLPSIYLFLLFIISLNITSIQNLHRYYKNAKNKKRIRNGCYLILFTLVIANIVGIIDYNIRYFLGLISTYYDIALFVITAVLLSILIAQKKFSLLFIDVNALMYQMVEKIPDSIAIFNSRMRLTWYNKNCENLFSTDEATDTTSTIKNFIVNTAKDFYFKDRNKFQTKYTKDDKSYDLLFSSLPIYTKNGHFHYSVFYIQDISSFEHRKARISKQRNILEQKVLAKTLLIKRHNLRLKKLLAEKAKLEEKNFSILNFDPSTNLFNRNMMIQKINSLIHTKEHLYVVYIDIDDVRIFNDLFGYDVMDILISQVAIRLNELPYDKAISRFGGDEFLVIFDQKTNISEACAEIQRVLVHPFIIDDTEIKITVSIGVSAYPNDGIDAVSLIRFADMAMYDSKSKGKNSISFFATELREKLEKEFFIAERIKEELSAGTMKIYSSPIVYLDTCGKRNMVLINVLGHWTHGLDLVLNETEFFDSMRKAGVLKAFDRWIFKNAIKKFAEYRHANPESDLKLLIHLSEKSFYSPIFFDYILEVLSLYSISSEYLEIEITEETLMYAPELSIKNIQQCQHLGIGITIKNFGLTYSSLAYLDKLNISKIKINRSFVAEIGRSIKDEGIVKLFISLANKINIKVIAEGVDTVEQLQFLLQHGCRYFEGALFAQKIEFDNLIKIMDSSEIVI